MYCSSNRQPCQLLLLVGPKGAGKTHLGGLLERYLDVHFLRIEPLFLELMRAEPDLVGVPLERKGFQRVVDRLDELALFHRHLCIESTGAAHTFPEFLAALQRSYRVLLIQVKAPLEVCAQRVMMRDGAAHIPVSGNRLHEINTVASQVDLPWDRVIDNTACQEETLLVQAIQPLLLRR